MQQIIKTDVEGRRLELQWGFKLYQLDFSSTAAGLPKPYLIHNFAFGIF